MRSPEAQVVHSLKRHLLDRGLAGVVPDRILVDADPSYIHSRFAHELEPMARVEVGGGRPDVLCTSSRPEGALVAGFEVKGVALKFKRGNWLFVSHDATGLEAVPVPIASTRASTERSKN